MHLTSIETCGVHVVLDSVIKEAEIFSSTGAVMSLPVHYHVFHSQSVS